MKSPSPAALMALKTALTAIYWTQNDFQMFVRAAVPAPEVLNRLNWNQTKKNVATDLINALVSEPDAYAVLLDGLIVEICRLDDFSHLNKHDYTGRMATDAEKAVVALRKWLPQATVGRPQILPEHQYEVILTTLKDAAMVMERTPQSFKGADEETIRDHLLVSLNAVFQGQVTGESFNGAGKTDILLRSEGQNIFIAECKVWTGPSAFDKAVDQLFSYLTWRDCKCAILVFNRNMDSTAVERKMDEVVRKRAEFRKTISFEPGNRGQYLLAKPSDPEKEITLTTLVFDVPTREAA
ncbi:MAG TPA: hypothetical protein VHR66_08055 [Gemmataceae bacterium]|nr:hypothetical protein [Gemmataceae bacterium]